MHHPRHNESISKRLSLKVVEVLHVGERVHQIEVSVGEGDARKAGIYVLGMAGARHRPGVVQVPTTFSLFLETP